ncbi:MAG: hypothetical protein ACK57Y_14815 [Pirellulaceae bacterium]
MPIQSTGRIAQGTGCHVLPRDLRLVFCRILVPSREINRFKYPIERANRRQTLPLLGWRKTSEGSSLLFLWITPKKVQDQSYTCYSDLPVLPDGRIGKHEERGDLEQDSSKRERYDEVGITAVALD